MNQLGETCDLVTNAVTTSFQIQTSGNRPAHTSGAIMYSNLCSLGWRFGYFYAKRSDAAFYFDPSNVDKSVQSLTVNISFASSSGSITTSPISRLYELPKLSVLLVTRTKEEATSCPIVSFEVTPTFKDSETTPPLQDPPAYQSVTELQLDQPADSPSHHDPVEKSQLPLEQGSKEDTEDQLVRQDPAAGIDDAVPEVEVAADEDMVAPDLRSTEPDQSVERSTEELVEQLEVPSYESDDEEVPEFSTSEERQNISYKSQASVQISPSQALAQSLITGVFIDTKFYAYSRRGIKGGARFPQPIYASSAILRGSSSFLANELGNTDPSQASIVELRSISALRKNLCIEYSYECDSDLDDEEVADQAHEDITSSRSSSSNGSTLPPVDPLPTFQVLGRTLLVKGYAYKTWKALVYYLYTGAIAFSNLKSERLPDVKDNVMPFPCSPKSMYRLADNFGLEDLKERAFESICSKISKDNVVDEVFSTFTSQYPAVQAVELQFLIQHINTPAVMSAFPCKFDSIAKGSLPHCAGILTKIVSELAARRILEEAP